MPKQRRAAAKGFHRKFKLLVPLLAAFAVVECPCKQPVDVIPTSLLCGLFSVEEQGAEWVPDDASVCIACTHNDAIDDFYCWAY
jgi:hypothetical protein